MLSPAILAAACLVACPLLAQDHTTGKFFDCAPEGVGGDPALNAQKNRDLPPDAYKKMTVAQVIAVHPKAEKEGKKTRDQWTDAERIEMKKLEDTGITVVGYIADIEKEGKEACNCGSTDHVDHHVWLVGKPGQKRSQGMVVEMSPRLTEKHPGDASFVAHPDWPALVAKAKKNGDLVRVSGWRTWDQEHPEQLKPAKNRGATRGTLWEIHPILVIEVQDKNDNWVPIDQQ
jgi:hypothetical protein